MKGRKDDAGKARYDLIPHNALHMIVEALTFGAAEYGEGNWREVEHGTKRYYAAMWRHATAWWRGEPNDPKSGLPHLAHAGACLMFLLEAELDRAEKPAETPTYSSELKPVTGTCKLHPSVGGTCKPRGVCSLDCFNTMVNFDMPSDD